jgi:hypothetical protein
MTSSWITSTPSARPHADDFSHERIAAARSADGRM